MSLTQGKFRRWLDDANANAQPPSTETPTIFRMIDYPGVLWEWPVFRDGPEFANTFAGLVKFNKQVMRLGKKAREEMKKRSSSVDGNKAGFLGVHLRTEADIRPFWPTYEEQEQAYSTKATELGFSMAYVACGSQKDVEKFAEALKTGPGTTVVSKADLLTGADAKELESLAWDQQALIDYIVLTGADYFVGNSRSSFSVSVVQKRHLRTEGLYTRPYKIRPDGYGSSYVVGPKEEYYNHWMFMWEAMWP